MDKRLIGIIISLSTLIVVAQEPSTTETAPPANEKVTELSEVVVNGDNVWVEGSKIIFKPQKNAKNLATDATSLIDMMNTGIMFVEGGTIKSRNGQNVTIFINGVKADNLDLATFWPKNAIRVEYIESSDDPRFAGYTNIVNFVMRDYVAGGLTRINVNQEFPNNGNYSLSSKLVWGKMTYNALFSGGYDHDHLIADDNTETYQDVWYNGQHYPEIVRKQQSHSVKRNDKIYGGFNARYTADKYYLIHNASIQWARDPESYTNGSLQYSPSIIDANSMNSLKRSRSLGTNVSGFYNFNSTRTRIFQASWFFNYTHNNDFSQYSELSVSPILNRVRENVYRYFLSGVYWEQVRSNMWLQLVLSEDRTISTASYTGTTVSNQWQQNGVTTLTAIWTYKPVAPVMITVMPKVTYNDWNVAHQYKKNSWLPGVEGTVNWAINRKNSLTANLWYYENSPSSSMRNDLILRQTELKWLEGNPSLKTSHGYSASLSWFSNPLSWFTFSLSADYRLSKDELYLDYRSGGEEYDGVIGEYRSAGNRNFINLGWFVAVKLFGGKLNLSNQLEYKYYTWDYPGAPKVGNWHDRPQIIWYFGNCSLRVRYNSPQKSLENGGTIISRIPYQCGIKFSYGNGNLNLSVDANNIFNKHLKLKSSQDNGSYHTVSYNWIEGRSFNVSLTYTFDYGKKVNPSIDISEENIQQSNILRTGSK